MPSRSYKRAQYINGPILKKIIKIRKTNQQEISEKVDLGFHTLSRAVNNCRLEKVSKIFALCKELDVDPALIMSESVMSKSDNTLITPDNLNKYIREFPYSDLIEVFLNTDETDALLNKLNSRYKYVDDLFKYDMFEVLQQVGNIMVETYLSADSNDNDIRKMMIYENLKDAIEKRIISLKESIERKNNNLPIINRPEKKDND